MTSNSTEMLWLRAATRACMSPELLSSSIPNVLPTAEPDWTRLLWLARIHRGLLFLAESVAKKHLPLSCPAEIRASLDELRIVARLQQLARTAEVVRLGDALRDRSVTWAACDDWMFTQSFAPDTPFVEITDPIQLLVATADLPRARAALVAVGHDESTQRFQVARTDRPPVKLIAATDPAFAAGVTIASRSLLRRSVADWLRFLAIDRSGPGRADLVRAWQIVFLASRASAEVVREPEVAAAVQRSRIALGLAAAPAAGSTPAADHAGDLPTAPFVPTPNNIVERILALAETTASDTVLDLGSGDGRVVLTAARHFGAQAIGIDSDAALIAEATARAEQSQLGGRARFVCADYFSADVSAATVIYLYLLPALYGPVRERVLRHARPGTRVVSHDFLFPDWPPEKTVLVRKTPTRMAQIYLWRIP